MEVNTLRNSRKAETLLQKLRQVESARRVLKALPITASCGEWRAAVSSLHRSEYDALTLAKKRGIIVTGYIKRMLAQPELSDVRLLQEIMAEMAANNKED